MEKSKATNLVLYDDGCPLCTFQMRLLTWLDWFNTIHLMPISNPRAAQIAPDLTREKLLEAIHCVSRDGKIQRGAHCLRFVGMRMPILIPMALFLWIPGVIWIAEKIYNHVSRNRHWLSRIFGCKEACEVFLVRKRQSETETQIPKR